MIGPNGAGKSTALKAVFGMIDIQSGDILFQDKSIKGLKKANWNYKNDKIGSETFRIVDSDSLRQAVDFALKAYEIAVDWSR